MDSYTLDSIAKLFALAANRQSEENTDKFVNVFKRFLSAEIEDKYADDFLDVFTKYLNDFSSASSKKRVSLNSVKLIGICEEIRTNISATERLIIIYFLIVLIKETGCSELSKEFTALISEMFGISEKLYSNIAGFISSKNEVECQDVYVDDNCIAKILVTDFEIIFVKPLVDDLSLNSRRLLSCRVVYILKDSVIVFRNVKKFFYPELFLIAKSRENTNAEKFYLNIRDIELKKNNKQILNKTSVDFCSGELIAVIGKSGSGKTSFLRSVAGIENKTSGKLYLSGLLSHNHDLCKSYVPQSNDFIPLFTVEEHLQHRCDFMQISKNISVDKINRVLSETGLTEEIDKIVCRSDKTAFQLSGGQQKRLGIAMELINDPDILFLDEPTSGLSSEDSYKIVNLLRYLANKNKIVVASIHQPDFDIFMKFDKVLIIDEGGYPVYFGSPADTVDYFRKMLKKVDKNSMMETRYNPAVILKMIEDGKFDEKGNGINSRKYLPSEFYEHFVSRTTDIKENLQLCKFKERKQNACLSFLNQLKFSINIDIKQKSRLILLLLIPFVSGIVFSLLLRYSPGQNYIYFYNPNIPVWILIILTTAIFTGLVNSGHEFIFLRQFHQHENRIVDKSGSYLCSIILKYLLLSFVQSFLLILPSVLIIENSFHFLALLLMGFLLIFWGSLTSLIISALVKQISTVYLLIPIVMIPQLIFSGAMINFGEFHKIINKQGRVPVIADVIPMRWASEAVITDFYTNNPFYKDVYPLRQNINNAVYYLDYFIPKIEEIAINDKSRAERIIGNEMKNPGFVDMLVDEGIDINFLKSFYFSQKSIYILLEDSICMHKEELKTSKFKYSNEAVNIVINNSIGDKCIEGEDVIYRNYKSVYVFPRTIGLNRSFLKSYGNFLNVDLACYIYNALMLIIYTLALIVILFIIRYAKRF
ncbi:MAG TPA: ATP-binding cassette domain-containing protein [Bacteroidales bacterium]|nr:ATP-binding cassette domain-containing protein [Bacteroidales bacterium]